MHALDQGSLLFIGGVVGGVLLALWALGAWLGTLSQPEQKDPELEAALKLPPEKRERALIRWLLHIGPRRQPPPSDDEPEQRRSLAPSHQRPPGFVGLSTRRLRPRAR
jgi:hypothetical protein